MKKPWNLFLLLLLFGVVVGCGQKEESSVVPGPDLSFFIHIGNESVFPFANHQKTLRSPSGRFTLEYVDTCPQAIVLKDAKGKKIGEVRSEDMRYCGDFAWGPTDDYFYFRGHPEDNKDSSNIYLYCRYQPRVYLYSTRTRTYRVLSDMEPSVPGIPIGSYYAGATSDEPPGVMRSPGDRYLLCAFGFSWPGHRPEMYGDSSAYAVFDMRKEFKQVLALSAPTKPCLFSPDGTKLAFQSIVKDEFGDYAKHQLVVADLATGESRVLASSRYDLPFVWAGTSRLAAVIPDKYTVSSLCLLDLNGGRTVLVNDPHITRVRPEKYDSRTGVLMYRVRRGGARPYEDELWAVAPGFKPWQPYETDGPGGRR